MNNVHEKRLKVEIKKEQIKENQKRKITEKEREKIGRASCRERVSSPV